jgi:hypothetical protein
MLFERRWSPALARAARYLALATLGHALWEAGQVPLYTVWSTGTQREVFLATAHCTGGDVLITVSTLSIAAGDGVSDGEDQPYVDGPRLARLLGRF